jgi:hypothetical protein
MEEEKKKEQPNEQHLLFEQYDHERKARSINEPEYNKREYNEREYNEVEYEKEKELQLLMKQQHNKQSQQLQSIVMDEEMRLLQLTKDEFEQHSLLNNIDTSIRGLSEQFGLLVTETQDNKYHYDMHRSKLDATRKQLFLLYQKQHQQQLGQPHQQQPQQQQQLGQPHQQQKQHQQQLRQPQQQQRKSIVSSGNDSNNKRTSTLLDVHQQRLIILLFRTIQERKPYSNDEDGRQQRHIRKKQKQQDTTNNNIEVVATSTAATTTTTTSTLWESMTYEQLMKLERLNTTSSSLSLCINNSHIEVKE